MYQLLLYVHVVSGVIWVGGAFVIQLFAIQAQRSADVTDVPRLARTIDAMASRVFIPAATLILLSGAAMTVQAWSFGRLWIVVAVVLWVASAVAGAAYIAPRIKRAVGLFDLEGPDSPTGRALVDRLFLVSRLELGSFAIILALMVFKPTL